MIIDREGKPAFMLPEQDGELLWRHCFGNEAIVDTKVNRAKVTMILAAHNESADYIWQLKRGK